MHEDREFFREVVDFVSSQLGLSRETVEKDYYVTMILKLLAQTHELCVFKGGTSLSKCFHAIERFSEDIDITFTEHLGEARRKKLKYKVLGPIADELGLTISNWDSIESDKDYNAYFFKYKPITEYSGDIIKPEVKLETALVSYAFPTEMKSVSNLVYETLKQKNFDFLQKYGLQPFDMRVQSLSRIFVDKIFALCDYYMQGKSKRYSRHLYDLYKLRSFVCIDDTLKNLIIEVRRHRQNISGCPSAKAEVDIREVVEEFCDNDFYANDYHEFTEYFIFKPVPYEDTIINLRQVVGKLF